MLQWSLEKIHLPLKFAWKISRNTSAQKTNYIVRAEENGLSGWGEIAFNVRYGESEESVERGFRRFLKLKVDFQDADDLQTAMKGEDLDKSLRFGLESAWVRLQAKKQGRSVARFLGLPEAGPVKTSFSLPILEVGEIEGFIATHGLKRFSCLKIKVDEAATERVREVARHFPGPLRVDANEAWKDPDAILKFMEEVSDLPIEFIEQPLPSDLRDELLYLKKKSPRVLIADESITDEGVGTYHAERFHGVNVKLMKAGGYLPALAQLRRARELGLKTMLGCMVETSVGISSALDLGTGVDYFDLDGFLLIKRDPYNWVEEKNGALFPTCG